MNLPVKTLWVKSEENQLDQGMRKEQDSNRIGREFVNLVRVFCHIDAHAYKLYENEKRMHACIDFAQKHWHAAIVWNCNIVIIRHSWANQHDRFLTLNLHRNGMEVHFFKHSIINFMLNV